jgi:hypothetical protein
LKLNAIKHQQEWGMALIFVGYGLEVAVLAFSCFLMAVLAF